MQAVGDIEFELIRRKVKHLRIQVLPPDGIVKVISPRHLDNAIINEFIAKRSAWIKKHQTKFKQQKPATELRYSSGEIHYLWGKPHTLRLINHTGTPNVSSADNIITMQICTDLDIEYRRLLLDDYYKYLLNYALNRLMQKWQPLIQVQASSFYIRKMKTRWGSCNVHTKRIAFNLDLVKKPMSCIEYVVVHELVHLLEPSHNVRFKNFMDQFLADWRARKKLLNA